MGVQRTSTPSARSAQLIVALDDTELPAAVRMAKQLTGLVRTLKIGSALFTACGPAAIHRIRALGFQVMLDLKFFDIPSTVELSCRAAVRQRVSCLTIHAVGGSAMLEAAVHGVRAEAARARVARPQLFAVTLLTSAVNGSAALGTRVVGLARAALRAGCDGVVASARDAAALRRAFGARCAIVCPGIRLSRAGHDDQRRICTPAQAIARGASTVVVGRPITLAPRPREVAQRILDEIAQARTAMLCAPEAEG